MARKSIRSIKIKKLAKITGMSLMDCSRALDEANGDISAAINILLEYRKDLSNIDWIHLDPDYKIRNHLAYEIKHNETNKWEWALVGIFLLLIFWTAFIIFNLSLWVSICSNLILLIIGYRISIEINLSILEWKKLLLGINKEARSTDDIRREQTYNRLLHYRNPDYIEPLMTSIAKQQSTLKLQLSILEEIKDSNELNQVKKEIHNTLSLLDDFSEVIKNDPLLNNDKEDIIVHFTIITNRIAIISMAIAKFQKQRDS